LWPRASNWLVPASEAGDASIDLAVLGVPAHATSITPTGAHKTPAAVRDALARYSTYAAARGIDVADLLAVDFGDVAQPDGVDGDRRVAASVAQALGRGARLLIAIGGDNSITCPVMRALAGEAPLSEWGLITVDAHHDLRDGITNGSPVRRLVEAGLPGEHIVQLGIADFSNSAAYAARAAEYGITVIHRAQFGYRPLGELVAYALDRAGSGGRPVFVDIDVDVCDRATVPACPSAAPGGLSAAELRDLAFAFGRDPRVRGIDITEIDATIDAVDRRTIRLGALLLLEAAAGLAGRNAGRPY